MYISQRIPFFNSGTLKVIQSVLSSSFFSDTARNELDAVERRLEELASGPATSPHAGPSPTPKVERLQSLLLSVFPQPEESRWIESLLAQGNSISGKIICQVIQEQFSRLVISSSVRSSYHPNLGSLSRVIMLNRGLPLPKLYQS
jgi:hypothetical protein